MKRNWYEIRNAEEDVAELLIYDEIGSGSISAKDFVKELGAVRANTINLRVNSPGGDVFDAVSIYNSLKNHKATVNVVVDGLAASSAAFITQAGDTVLMATGATMMIHEPNGMTIGAAEDHAKMAETLDKMGDTIASLFAGRAGGTEAEWRDRMRDESWYRAQEAVDIKLADGIVNGQQARAPAGIFNLSKFNNVPDWVPQDEGEALSIEDPYPNEHACRLRDPGDFKEGSFRRTSREHEGKSYDVILGRLEGETTMTEQAYRYPKGTWDADEARSHCQDHDGTFEAASEDKTTRLVNVAIPSHETAKAPEGEAWEAPTLGDFTDESWENLSDAERRRIATHYVWTESMPPETFGDLAGPHHKPSKSGVGAVVWRAVSSGRMAQTSWYNDPGVRRHLTRHYEQFGKTPPWEEDKMDPLLAADWRGALGEYARYDAPEPNLEKLLEKSPLQKQLDAGIAASAKGEK